MVQEMGVFTGTHDVHGTFRATACGMPAKPHGDACRIILLLEQGRIPANRLPSFSAR
jgi:hypothetical protein